MANQSHAIIAPAQLIVCFKEAVNIEPDAQRVIQSNSHDVTSIQECLKEHDAHCRPLFGPSPQRVQQRQAAAVKAATADGAYDYEHPLSKLPSFASFYHVLCDEEKSTKLVEKLNQEEHVEAAYWKPPTYLPLAPLEKTAAAGPAPSTTPSYLDRQIYLNPAPAGIDAKISWVLPGGTGAGVKVIDCENGWNLNHEDLLDNQGGLVAGTASTNIDNTNHGTAVFGEISGDNNAFGITGIAPDSVISASSWASVASSTAIRSAADKLSPGDVILLEGHRPGPNAPNPPPDRRQIGYIAIEWWPDDLLAIQYAVGKGIVVVAAAGNGDQNLEDPVYDRATWGSFPNWWKNPFNRNNPPSGSILAGAGQPPPGTHGRQTKADRSRCHEVNSWGSNYAWRVDAQGWGVEVTTAGYGSLQSGDQNVWYTDTFGGTSSASPIVVGSLLCVQGILKARGRRPLTPLEAKLLLRNTGGTSQQSESDAPFTQRIGRRPNLRKLIPAAARWKSRSAKFDGSGQANIFVTNSSSVGLLRQSGNTMSCPVVVSNGTMLNGGWRINTADNIYSSVGSLTSAGAAEALAISPWGISVLRVSSGTLEAKSITANGTRIGAWLLNTKDNSFGNTADFDGNGTSEIIVTSRWGLGILQASGGSLRPLMMVPNGTRFGGWLLNTNDNDFSCVGMFNGSSKPKRQILVTSPWGIGILQYNSSTGTLDALAMKPNGTRLGGWLLNTADSRFGPVGDFDGDGTDEILVTSPAGIGLLKLSGSDITSTLVKTNGTRFGQWLLNTADNSFGPAADLTGDGRAELLVTSPWGIAVLRQEGSTMTTAAMHANGSRLGGWLLNTDNDTFAQAADFAGVGRAALLATSGWGLGVLELRPGTSALASSVMMPNGSSAGQWKVDTNADDYGDGW